MAVSRAVLAGPCAGPAPGGGGADEVVMIADRNGPNLWAARLGYQLVGERAVLRFGPVDRPAAADDADRADAPAADRAAAAAAHGCAATGPRCRGGRRQEATASASVTSAAVPRPARARTRSRRCCPPPAGRPRWPARARLVRPAHDHPRRLGPHGDLRRRLGLADLAEHGRRGREHRRIARARPAQPPRRCRHRRPGRAVHRPLLPPGPRLLGHERQERREQPQQHRQRRPQRAPRRRAAAPGPYARAFTSSR